MCYWFDCKNNKKELCGKKYFFMQQEFLDKTLEKRGGFPNWKNVPFDLRFSRLLSTFFA